MAQYQWQFNTETGTFKNHALSRELFNAALEESTFMDHVQPVESFGKKMGESVLLTRISRLSEPTTSDLQEDQRIPEDDYAVSTTLITVNEVGRSVPFTSFAEDLTWYDLENSVQKTLRDQMTLTLDTKAAKAFKGAKVKYQLTGLGSGTFTTNGTFAGASVENWNVFHVEEIADFMYDTLQVPTLDNDDYVAIVRTLGLRGIKRDPDWEEWHKYTDPAAKFNGETGRIENIRFVRTNHNNALGKVGTGSVLGEGVVFGQDAVAMAEVLTPELRAAIPDDFGRSKGIAWYGILNFGEIWQTGNAGEAKIVHVGSS